MKKEYQARLLGAEPVTMAETTEADGTLAGWERNGYRGMAIVHLGARAGLEPVRDRNAADLQKFYRSGDREGSKPPVRGSDVQSVDGSNYLSAAASLGIIKRIFWVIPYPFFDTAGGGERVRRFLVDQGVVKDRYETEGFSMTGGCLQGRVRNIEFSVCAPDTLPLIREIVLLDLDEDFIAHYSLSRDLSPLGGFKLVMDALFARRFRIAAASMTAPGGKEGRFDPAFLYIGSQVREAFRKPSILGQELPPPVWSARDEAFSLLQKREFVRAYAALKTSIRKHGPDRGLRALLSIAALQRNKYDEALSVASALFQADGRYSVLLEYLATLAEEKAGPERARVFRERARSS